MVSKYASPELLKELRVVTFFITTRCNARCETCFYWSSLNDSKLRELTLEEIETISRSMPPFTHLLLSGGEPVMRRELTQIVDIFVRNNGVVTVDFPTNGLLTRRIVEVAETILDAHPQVLLTVGNSVDGLEETHDRLRAVPGNFKKVIETIDALSDMRARRIERARRGEGPMPKMQLVTLTTVNVRNLDEIEALAEEFSERFDLDCMMFEALRPVTKDPSLRPPTPEQHDRIVQLSMRINGKLYSRHFAEERAMRLSYLRGVYRMQRKVLGGGLLPVTCQAGNRLAVIEPDGRVRVCEFLEPAGSLRDVELDWAKLWLGAKAVEQRRWIEETRCTCSHCVNLGHSIDRSLKTRLVRKADEAALALLQ